MSRIGQKPVDIPEGVEINVEGQIVRAKGKLGELSVNVHENVAVKMDEVANDDDGNKTKVVIVEPKTKDRFSRQIWPTMRTLINNIVIGVSEGYSKKLLIQGVGYRANLQGTTLNMALGFSHDVKFPVPDGIKIDVQNQTEITITGIDKQQVGQVAANIRSYRPPEPYKGKGIRYDDEYVIRKEGKKK